MMNVDIRDITIGAGVEDCIHRRSFKKVCSWQVHDTHWHQHTVEQSIGIDTAFQCLVVVVGVCLSCVNEQETVCIINKKLQTLSSI